MRRCLVLSFEFLDSAFHGRSEDGRVEWPPSPLRALQALVAAASGMERIGRAPADVAYALRWIERQPPPRILTAPAMVGEAHRAAVPNNDLDVVARAWAQGREPAKKPVELKTMKQIQQVRLDPATTVRYVWVVPAEDEASTGRLESGLRAVARSVVALGWGLDLVAGDASVVGAEHVPNDGACHWYPAHAADGHGLRVPVPGTLDDLDRRYRAFLGRLDGGILTVPPPLSAWRRVEYRQDVDPVPLPCAAFALCAVDRPGYRPYDVVREGLTVAGMARHAVAESAEASGRDARWVGRCVYGHDGDGHVSGPGLGGSDRFLYLPMPSVEPRRPDDALVVGPIRRLAVCWSGSAGAGEIDWARSYLPGCGLVREGRSDPESVLAPLPDDDFVLRRYTDRSSVWATVTPVVLPGFDDTGGCRRRLARGVPADEQHRLLGRLHQRVEGLLRKALRHAGFVDSVASCAELDWGPAGFLPGVAHARRYGVPSHARGFPRYHVRIAFRDARGRPLDIPGPLVLGKGRFYGVGLFAAVP